ncbi:hypothetical protein CF327_g2187 [Tilletia walkeri]|nr:hypothetical protein CF327_g2187 [Tilletia walkeri]
MGNNHSASSATQGVPSSTTLPSASTHSQPPSPTAPAAATMEASQQRPRHSLDGNSSRDEAMDWNPERDDTQPSRRVRARLADALLSLSSSPPSNNISSASTQQSTSSTSPQAALSQQQQQAQSSVPASGAMSSAQASTSTASVSHSGDTISSRPPVTNNSRIGPYGRIIRPLPHRTSARQGTRSSQSQQTRRQYTAHRIPRPPIVLNSSSSSSSSDNGDDDGSSQGIPEPAPRRAAADRLPHLQHHLNGQQQQNLSGEEVALLQEYATLSALVSEIIGGVPPPIPRVVGGYPEAPSSSIPFPSAASSSSTLRGSATAAASSTSSAETSRPSRVGGSRRPDGQREIRAGTSIIVQGALYTRTARRGESSDTSSPAPASASAGASSRSTQASSSSSTVPRSRRTSSPSSPSAPQQASTPSSPPAAGPSPTERAHMLNRLLRVAAAATAATIVSRSEGLVPPPAAAPGPGGFGEFVGRNAFGSRAGAGTVPGAGVGAQGQSRSRGGHHHQSGGSGSGVAAAAAALTNRARSSWDGSRSSSTTTPSGSSTGGAAAGLRSLLGGHRRSLQRSMQRSGNSLDLLADSRSSRSGTSSPSSTLASASAETRSLSDVGNSGHPRLPGSWIDAGLDALQARIGRSSVVRGDGPIGRPTGLRQRLTSLAPWMRASRAVAPLSSSASGPSSSQARGGPSIARASTDQESIRSGHEDDGEADEGEALTQMLRESLAHPMPSRVQRSRSVASLRTRGRSEGTPSASTGGGQAGSDSTGHPSTSARGNTPSGSNASASAEPIPPHGVRVDIRDSAASISAFLDRARAGVESGSGEGQDGAPLQGSFEWFLNTLCTDLEAAMAEMDVEQERVARVEAAVRRGAREARAGARAEEEAGEGGGVDAETSAAEESVAEILRRVFGSGTTSASADPNDPNSVPERRRGDVHNAELSFFRMFCFPRANQAGVSPDSLAPSPSNIHPPAGAASMGVGSEFVLHPDLIPCVVVGVRSMTAADERRYAGDEDGDEGDDDDEEEEVVEEQRPQTPQTPQTPPSLPGAWGWARRFPWRSSSRASSARASSPSPATTPVLRDPDGDVIMREARPDAQDVEDEDEASSVDTSGSEDIGTVDSEDDSEEEEGDRDDQAGLPPRSWRFMLWVSGGFWPRSHPLLRAPAPAAGRDLMLLIEFLTAMASPSVPPPGDPNIHGRAPGFPPPAGGVPTGLGGALMELFGLMGNGHAPRPKATKTELEKSAETRVAKGWELGVALKKGKGKATSKAAAGGKNLVEQGVVLESTAQRCLICLEEWEDDDEVRILSCRHAFHVDCVDRWLIQSSNTCPMCRKAGVTKDNEEGRVPAPPVESV